MTGQVIFEAGHQTLHVQFNEKTGASHLMCSSEQVFEQVYKASFRSLHAYAYTILRNESVAEEVVQQVFYKLWEKKDELDWKSSLTPYLYRAVHNESLNYLKHLKIRQQHRSHTVHYMPQHTENASKKIVSSETDQRLRKALNELPRQCRIIFQLSRFDELKYHEIAAQMGISVKTVENQMGKALRLLRSKLADILPILIWLIMNINNH